MYACFVTIKYATKCSVSVAKLEANSILFWSSLTIEAGMLSLVEAFAVALAFVSFL